MYCSLKPQELNEISKNAYTYDCKLNHCMCDKIQGKTQPSVRCNRVLSLNVHPVASDEGNGLVWRYQYVGKCK